MSDSLNRLSVITLFVERLGETKSFYQDVFDTKVVYEDEVSAVLQLSNLMLNLLNVSEAPGLVEPATVAGPETGSRWMLSIFVDDTDAVCQKLNERGVVLINGPIDRPWGKRTATFADPAGNVWEIAQDLP